jgi:hypothetical protein
VNLTNLATILAKYEDKIESIEIKKSDRIEIIVIEVEKIKGKI